MLTRTLLIGLAMLMTLRVHAAPPPESGLAVLFVLDVSGSMAGPKLELSKATIIEAVNGLGSSDSVGVLTFDSRVSTAVPLARLQMLAFSEAVQRIRTSGGTNIGEALHRARQILAETPARARHLVLVTDGQAVRDHLLAIGRELHEAGITLSSVAVGVHAEDASLRELAERVGGSHYVLLDPDHLPPIHAELATRSKAAQPIKAPKRTPSR